MAYAKSALFLLTLFVLLTSRGWLPATVDATFAVTTSMLYCNPDQQQFVHDDYHSDSGGVQTVVYTMVDQSTSSGGCLYTKVNGSALNITLPPMTTVCPENSSYAFMFLVNDESTLLVLNCSDASQLGQVVVPNGKISTWVYNVSGDLGYIAAYDENSNLTWWQFTVNDTLASTDHALNATLRGFLPADGQLYDMFLGNSSATADRLYLLEYVPQATADAGWIIWLDEWDTSGNGTNSTSGNITRSLNITSELSVSFATAWNDTLYLLLYPKGSKPGDPGLQVLSVDLANMTLTGQPAMSLVNISSSVANAIVQAPGDRVTTVGSGLVETIAVTNTTSGTAWTVVERTSVPAVGGLFQGTSACFVSPTVVAVETMFPTAEFGAWCVANGTAVQAKEKT